MTIQEQRLAELKGRIASQMGKKEYSLMKISLNVCLGHLIPFSVEERDRPVHVTIDKEGRTIDTLTGEVLQIPNRVPTLKANLRVQKKDVIKQEHPKIRPAKEIVIEQPGLDASAPFFDARIG